MFIVYYEPHNDKVILLPDSLCEQYVLDTIKAYKEKWKKETGFISITVGQELIINYIRLYICRGILDFNDVEFHFDNLHGRVYILKPNRYGRLSEWPVGFCNYTDQILMGLLENMLETPEEKNNVNV
jgi:hypothetical protein